jgi:hypothetical protein
MTSSNAEQGPERSRGEHVPAEELARRQGARPIKSVKAIARLHLFESDEELDEFLADSYASRRAGMA